MRNRKIQGAIFDVDGTLLDSMSIWDNIGEDYLRSIGHEPRENLAETFKEMSLYQAACYYRTKYEVPLSPEEIIEGINRMVENFYLYEAPLKPGAAGFLESLYRGGVKMCVATATDQLLIKGALDRCGVGKYFSKIFTCETVGHGKDEPFIYREGLKHLGTKLSDTVVFEDAVHALETAKADGFLTAAVYDGHEKEQDKMRAFADYYFKELSEDHIPFLLPKQENT